MLLAAVYGRADYGFAYPVARGAAPVLVLLISTVFLGATVSRGRPRSACSRSPAASCSSAGVGTEAVDGTSLVLALGVGACIAGYTLVDDHGIRYANAIPYFELVIAAVRDPVRRRDRAARGSGRAVDRRSLLAGVGMTSAYLLVLAALEKAEAAPVAALRETSVVMAAAFSKERSPTRIVGSVIVLLGHRRRRAGLTRTARRVPARTSSTDRAAQHVRNRRGATLEIDADHVARRDRARSDRARTASRRYARSGTG